MRFSWLFLGAPAALLAGLIQVPDQSLRPTPPSLDVGFWGKPHHPYTATILIRDDSSPNRTRTARAYRDDLGRERTEGFYDGGQLSLVRLRDPRQASFTFLYPVEKKVAVVPDPRPAPPPAGKGWTVQSLPERSIAGFPARGERFIRTIQPTTSEGLPKTIVEDIWYSDDLGIILEQNDDDPASGRSRRTVTHLELTEPDPSLFQVPPGYTFSKADPF